MILDVVYEIGFSCQKGGMWQSPLPFKLVLTDDPMSFKTMPEGMTGVPVSPHPGAWGVRRKHHVHEGVDLYAPSLTEVVAVEDGKLVAIVPFTGEHAGSPWWEQTWAAMVEGESGVVTYGEITVSTFLPPIGGMIKAGTKIGRVLNVLKKDKGRPMAMLHLELYAHGVREPVEWKLEDAGPPDGLRNPTIHLMQISLP